MKMAPQVLAAVAEVYSPQKDDWPKTSHAHCVPMSSLVLAAYVAALEYRMMWPRFVQTTRDVQVRKAGLQALRDGIVDTYLQSVEAAGWKAEGYLRKEVFQQR